MHSSCSVCSFKNKGHASKHVVCSGLVPPCTQAGGAGVVLHHWANAELERDNVRNARVVLAEALRKCPQDQPLYVLAAGVELAGGDPGAGRCEGAGRRGVAGREGPRWVQLWGFCVCCFLEPRKAPVVFAAVAGGSWQGEPSVGKAKRGEGGGAKNLHACLHEPMIMRPLVAGTQLWTVKFYSLLLLVQDVASQLGTGIQMPVQENRGSVAARMCASDSQAAPF
eukprot:scaffold115654_cov21-Tisochrysis_lutea.AAC.1